MPVPKAMPSPEGPETGEGSGVQPDTPAKKKSMSNPSPKKQLSMYDIFGKGPPVSAGGSPSGCSEGPTPEGSSEFCKPKKGGKGTEGEQDGGKC